MEVMAVVAIIALMSGAVILALGPDPDPAQDSARNLAKTLNRAGEAALTDGQTRTLALSREGWELRRFAGTEWQTADSGNFTTNADLFVEDAEVELTDEAIPHLIFEPTGQATPFRLELRSREGNWHLEGTDSGDVTVEAGRAR